jgi:ABC-type phosphate transport system substrate-binding protein
MPLSALTPPLTYLATLTLPLASCERAAESATPTDSDSVSSVIGAGSHFAAPIFTKWFEVYALDHSHLTLSYDSAGSGEGVDRLAGISGACGAGIGKSINRPDGTMLARGWIENSLLAVQ